MSLNDIPSTSITPDNNNDNKIVEVEDNGVLPVVPRTASPRIFLLVENPKKSNNLGAIFRCAAAFSVTQIVLVGYDKCNTEGSHGAAKHMDRIAFPTVSQAVAYLRDDSACDTFVGLLCNGAAGAYNKDGYPVYEDEELGLVSVDAATQEERWQDNSLPKSYPVHTKPFARKGGGGNFCVVLDKSRKGFPTNLAKTCDFFVHVPHAIILASDDDDEYDEAHDKKEGVLLDVPSCLSISLHHLTQWAGYDERVFQGHKFDVAFVQKGRIQTFQSTAKNSSTTTNQNDRAELKQETELAAETTLDGAALGSVFNDDNYDNNGDY